MTRVPITGAAQVHRLDEEGVVFKVRVHNEDFGEAVPHELVEQIGGELLERRAVQVDRAGKEGPAAAQGLRLIAVGEGGGDHAANRLGEPAGELLGEHRVHAERQVRPVLFGRADREDEDPVLFRLKFPPGHPFHLDFFKHTAPSFWMFIT